MPKILVVGAGGIGCELLKNLVLSGYEDITIIDLDTIDLSNLNRQFLFRQKHISQPKSIVAAQVVSSFNPNAKIKAFHSNIITDPQFHLEFFKSFDLVMNALDNIDARSHVNKMCLAANLPLIESGTAGLFGQATAHIKGQTECFDCTPKSKPTTFPVCTIRSTPSKPIHCIVWSKSFLFLKLFSKEEHEQEMETEEAEGENLEELKRLKEEAKQMLLLQNQSRAKNFPELVFKKIFCQDMERLRNTEDMWKDRQPPLVLNYEKLKKEKLKTSHSTQIDRDHQIWSEKEAFEVFLLSVEKLGKRFSHSGTLEFDKDDEEMMDFIASATHLRSHCFGIPLKSRFEYKQMVGNIIPAIATTNAVIAGLMLFIAEKILKGKSTEIKTTFLSHTHPKRMLHPESLSNPNPDCLNCSAAYLSLYFDFERQTLGDFVEFLKEKFQFDQELVIMKSDNSLIYDLDFEDHLEKKFIELGLLHGSQLTVTHETDDSEYQSGPVIFHLLERKEQNGFQYEGDEVQKKKKRKIEQPEEEDDEKENIDQKENLIEIDDDFQIIE